MCKASITARHVTDAREGESYLIGKSNHGLGALHPAGKTTAQCVACVKDQTVLTLSNIPSTLRSQLDLPAGDVRALFIDTGDNYHDMLEIGHEQHPLYLFADMGIEAYVGVKQQSAERGVGHTASRPLETVAA